MHLRVTHMEPAAHDAHPHTFEPAGAPELVNEYSGLEYSGLAALPASYNAFAELGHACPECLLHTRGSVS